MKKDSNQPFSLPGSIRHRRAGMALIIILSCLVLITGVIVAFFSSVTTELSAAKGYANGISTRELSDTALATVMGSIRSATTSGTGICWASQPGMIRTFDTSKTGSQGLACYKLYSSNKMVVNQADMPFDPQAEVVSNWNSLSALYTDLNAPVVSGTGLTYPIMDPSLDGVVEGFSLNAAKRSGYDTGSPASPVNNPMPMPVKWLYVLKDGSLTAPDSGDTKATWTSSGAVAPSHANPIVGRVAFWTDDETCKLNINTASEPTPWDSPRAVSGTNQSEILNGMYQPTDQEYQRFPGHPAMTALSPVFYPNQTTITQAQKNKIYTLVPRIQHGGSDSASATVMTGNGMQGETTGWDYSKNPPAPPNGSNSAPSVPLDKDRLYASVDELLFQPTVHNTRDVDRDIFTSTTLAKLHPFLTANSSAPELNLYGGPRISMWPVSSNTSATYRSVYDSSTALCSTLGLSGSVGARSYFFARNPTTATTGANSQTDDFTIARNQALYSYLQNVTNQDVPGFGGNFATKWGDDRDQVLTEIFDYIRCTNLHDLSVTSPYSAFNYTYSWSSTNSSQIYSRGQVVPIKITTGGKTTKGFGRFRTLSQFGVMVICRYDYAQLLNPNVNVHNAGCIFRNNDFRNWEMDYYNKFYGWVLGMPLPPSPPGAYVISGHDALVNGTNTPIESILNDNGDPVVGGTSAHPGFGAKYQFLVGKKIIQPAFLMEPFSPSVGYYQLNDDLYYDVTLTNFSIQVTSTSGSPNVNIFQNINKMKHHPASLWGDPNRGGRKWGGAAGIRYTAQSSPLVDNTPAGNIAGVNEDNHGIVIGTDASLTFNGGDIAVNVYTGPDQTNIYNGQTLSSPNTNQLVQTV